MQAGSYSAEPLRRAFGSLLARGETIGSIVSGLVAAKDMEVTAGSGMQVLVAPGEAWINGTVSATESGAYCRVTSSSALAISASDPSLPRIDRVVAVVKDAAYSGAENSFSLAVVTGTPTAGATLANRGTHGYPAAPASSLTLAAVLVPAKAASIVAEDVENVAPLLDLGLTLGAGAVGATQLASEAVTDAKVVANRALVTTNNAYGAQVSRANKTSYEPSATRTVHVILELTTEAGAHCPVNVGGVQIARPGMSITGNLVSVVAFLCPPKVKWEVGAEGEEAKVVASSYLTL